MLDTENIQTVYSITKQGTNQSRTDSAYVYGLFSPLDHLYIVACWDCLVKVVVVVVVIVASYVVSRFAVDLL